MTNPFNKANVINAKTFLPSHLILQGDAETLIWNKSLIRDRENKNAHWGQLKLCLTLIEFIITNVKFNPSKQVRIVYAGAANGRGTSIVASLFPWIEFDLFDSNKFYPKLEIMPNVSLFNQFFTDDCAIVYRQIGNEQFVEGHEARGKLISKGIRRPKVIASEDIYFVSDIRLNTKKTYENEIKDLNSDFYLRFLREKSTSLALPEAKKAFIETETEKSIRRDMEMQQKWVELINPVACQLKCRLPYPLTGIPKYFNYLDGIIYFQPFIGVTSSETRLVARRTETGYTRKDYNIVTYEQNLFAHNMYRMTDEYRNILTGNVEHYINGELINNYDCTCAAFILKECFRSIHARDPDSQELANFYIMIAMQLSEGFDVNSLAVNEGILAKLYRGSIKISGLGGGESSYQVTTTSSRIGSIVIPENSPAISTISVNLSL